MTASGTMSLLDFLSALERCMAQHPPQGSDRQLHRDADRLATVWARHHLARQSMVDVDALDDETRSALTRWFQD